MTIEYAITLDDPRATLEVAGGKGASLARLVVAGLPVPDGFHVTTAAYRQFVAENDLQSRILAALESVDPAQPATLEMASRAIGELFAGAEMPAAIAGAIAQVYAGLAGQNPTVAVRSSATAEDLPGLSFAGQQETYLNVQGAAAVLEAVKRCWASLWTARAIGYRERHDIDQGTVSLAVVVQLLVPAEAAGIMFTADPVSGARDQVAISAAWGLGEAVVGGLVTPDSLAVDKATGEVLARQTADKQVMTVRVDGGTEEQPVPEELRDAPVLSDKQAAELVRLGVQIEELYGMPMDIEWALADGAFAILQARPITALPEPAVEPLTEWPMPDPKGKYVRASIIDLMPDPISPLFATVAFKAYDAGLTRAMSDVTRSKAVLPTHFVTINDYVYSDTRLNGREMWWVLTRMLPAFPRMMRIGVSYWREDGRAPYAETVRRWEVQPLADLPAADLLDGACEIARAAMYNLTAQMVWMGACAGSEMLFTRVYDRLVKRAGEPDATAFLMGYDSTPIRAEKSLYDLAAWCRGRDALAAHVIHTSSDQIVAQLESDQIPKDVAAEDWQTFRERFRAHVQQFGHIIYNLDFAKPLPLDDPAPMLETVKLYLRGEGANPHERQGSLEARRVQATEAVLSRVKGLKRWAFTTTLRWAQSLAEVREDALADIGLGYPVLRRMLRELGRRLADLGTIENSDDVFWLRREELEQAVAALERGDMLPGMVVQIQERRAFSRAAKRATPPPVLPASVKKVMGFSVEGMVAAGEGSHTDNTIKGMGTSAGQVTAPACVLHGPEDFHQMQPGCVLVAGITTPAWTPLFAMAVGVVTDVGGPLSHGSIVAREYGIPAVMGTGVATNRIRSGQRITVDGSAGTVTLPEE
jgi:phosphohistidine swiveling domain-containing protein/phosphoglycolate phosphatase-like HAD superfamily hydrolase